MEDKLLQYVMNAQGLDEVLYDPPLQLSTVSSDSDGTKQPVAKYNQQNINKQDSHNMELKYFCLGCFR